MIEQRAVTLTLLFDHDISGETQGIAEAIMEYVEDVEQVAIRDTPLLPISWETLDD